MIKAQFRLLFNKLNIVLNLFKQAQSGVAAVEFALILPVMLLMYVGVVEITRLYAADRKAVIFAHTVADLATQATVDITSGFQSLSDGDTALVFGLSTAVLYPFNPTGADIRLTMIAFDKSSKAFVDWEDVCHITSTGCGSSVPLLTPSVANPRCTIITNIPAGSATPLGYKMFAEVGFQYTPILAGLFTGGYFTFMPATGITLGDHIYMQPRDGGVVIRTRLTGGIPTTAAPTNIAATGTGLTGCAPAFTP